MSTKTHRHFIAVPVAALALLMVVGAGHLVRGATPSDSFRSADQVFDSGESTLDFDSQYGFDGTLEPASLAAVSEAGDLILRRGTLTLRAEGYARIVMENAPVTAEIISGDVYVTRDSESLTVAPLSMPAIVTVSGQRTFVALSKQARIDLKALTVDVGPVAPRWLSEKQGSLSVQSAVQMSLEEPSDAELAQLTLESTGEARGEVIGLLSRLLASGLRSETQAKTAMLLLETLAPDHSLDLLLAFAAASNRRHALAMPVVGTALMEMPDGFANFDIAITLSKRGTLGARPLADAAAESWQTHAVHAATRTPADAFALLESALEFHNALSDAGYPAHAQFWQERIAHVARVAMSLVQAQDRAQIVDLLSALSIVQAEAPEAAQAESSAFDAASLPPEAHEQLLATAKAVLLNHGAMLTQQTIFEILGADTVRVTGVYFATASGDSAFDFSLNVSAQQLFDITQDGRQLPNAMLVSEFAASL